LTKDLLLEIGTEELPSSAVYSAIEQIHKNSEKVLKNYRIGYEEINSYGSPRRIVLYIKDIKETQSPLSPRFLVLLRKMRMMKKVIPLKLLLVLLKQWGLI